MPDIFSFAFCLIPVVLVAAFVLFAGLRTLFQYERGVVFQLGKFKDVRGPGLTFLLPILQSMRKVDMRIKTAEVPRQEVITKDNIPVLVNAVVYFKVVDPKTVIVEIEDYVFAIRQYTQAALRDVIGNNDLDFVLQEREEVAGSIKEIVDSETSAWGLDVESIKIQEVELPAEMKRAMAKQAEAERSRRAVIITSQGELSASENLRKAAENLGMSSGALHLRTLQTMRDIASDPSEKIIVFMPWELGDIVSKAVAPKKRS